MAGNTIWLMFVASDFALFRPPIDLRFQPHLEVDFENFKTSAKVFTARFFGVFLCFSLIGTDFSAGANDRQNDLVSVKFRIPRKTQNLVVATPCRFDPDYRHQYQKPPCGAFDIDTVLRGEPTERLAKRAFPSSAEVNERIPLAIALLWVLTPTTGKIRPDGRVKSP